jgi:hypothetical protein
VDVAIIVLTSDKNNNLNILVISNIQCLSINLLILIY